MSLSTCYSFGNVNGAFLGSKHAIAQFLARNPDVSGFRGTLINVSSIGGAVGLMRCTAYCAAKAAIIGLTRATALEYGDRGVRRNAILPGYISTAMLQPIVDADPIFAGYRNDSLPAGRLGTPQDVAGAAVWLADNGKSAYVTGTVIAVDVHRSPSLMLRYNYVCHG
ncbi:NAD(P)-binding protein [Periconia macrospinosa]|uniref:NAD(P)-binding protein n=1 Tax=Periconia macrospinosa TaxID=97972 RepID=A0A2V1D5N6_9PLEO|nr:NAD(P)-binding protein [Periconia macrospinosa]